MLEHFTAPHLLTGHPPRTPILVAFSGGADSVAMLAALREYAALHGTPLRLAHVNHGIRGEEAVRDRDFCVAMASRFGLPISVLDADVPAIRAARGGSMEEVARQVRYDFFARVMAEYDIPLLATAHHADDQLETILLRLTRGTGPDGLCGIPPLRAMGEGRLVIRPMLGCEKAELVSYCREQGLDFVVDSTNEDISYARNRIRRRVIPELRAINPAVTDAAARLSRTVRADVGYLTEQTDRFVREAVTLRPEEEGAVRVSVSRARLEEQGTALRRRVLTRMMRYAGCPQAEERFVCALDALREGALTLPGGVSARCERGVLWLCRESKDVYVRTERVSPDLSHLPQTVAFGDFCVTFGASAPICGEKERKDLPLFERIYKMSMNGTVKFDTIKNSLILRTRREGDRLLRGGHHRSLKKLFCDLGVPRHLRDRLPLLCDGEGILFVPGVGVRDGAVPTGCEQALTVSVTYVPDEESFSALAADRNTRNQQKEETDEE